MILVRSRSISRPVPAKNSVCGERGVGTIAEQRASIKKIDQVCEGASSSRYGLTSTDSCVTTLSIYVPPRLRVYAFLRSRDDKSPRPCYLKERLKRWERRATSRSCGSVSYIAASDPDHRNEDFQDPGLRRLTPPGDTQIAIAHGRQRVDASTHQRDLISTHGCI